MLSAFAIGMLERVQHGPEDIAFEHQRVDRRLLAFRRVGMLQHIGEGEVGIARGLFGPLAEIGQRVLGDVVVFGEHRRHALADDDRREQLRQRRGDRLEQRAVGAEGEIGADREARRRQRQPFALHRFGVEAERGRQMQPARDAAAPAIVAVMVLDALAPCGAEGRVLGAREDHGVLARNDRLVAVAIERPCLHFALRQRAAHHPVMVGMAVMVALGAHLPQHGFQLRRPTGRLRAASWKSLTARSPCRHSATSQPAARTAACSARILVEHRIGVVDVDEDAAADVHAGQTGDRAAFARHCKMTHAGAGLLRRRRRRSSRRRCRPCRRTAGRPRRRDARAGPRRSARSRECRRPHRRHCRPRCARRSYRRCRS